MSRDLLIKLDGPGESGCMSAMKTMIFVALLGALLAGAGCVSTVTDRKTAGVPFVRDSVQGRYERPVDQIFQAAKEVMNSMGAVGSETILHQTNIVKTITGRVNQRDVWIRVEAEDPKVTAVTVQARTQGGGGDLDLAHEIEKQIALKLR